MKYFYIIILFLLASCYDHPQTEIFYNNNYDSEIIINNDSLTFRYIIKNKLFNSGKFRRTDDNIYFLGWKDKAGVSIYDCLENTCIAAPNIYSDLIIFSEDEPEKNFYKN